jgi:DNA-binding MarR family transcriptional regulator
MAETERIEDLIVAFVRGFGLHRAEETPCGQPMPVSEAHALMELGRAGPVNQKELAVRLQLDKSTVSRLVDKLQGRGWLTREVDPDDARAARLRLTEGGRQAADGLAVAREAKFGRLLAALGPEDREAALRGLGALVRGMHRTWEEQGSGDQRLE